MRGAGARRTQRCTCGAGAGLTQRREHQSEFVRDMRVRESVSVCEVCMNVLCACACVCVCVGCARLCAHVCMNWRVCVCVW
jgi:hypothetical protein